MATGTPEDEMYAGDASDPRAAQNDRGVGHQVSKAPPLPTPWLLYSVVLSPFTYAGRARTQLHTGIHRPGNLWLTLWLAL